MSQSTRVTFRVEEGVADVRLDRPEKLNALDVAMFESLVATGEALRADRSVRAVVLSGEGRGFCAGLDFDAFLAMSQAPGAGGGAAELAGDLVRREPGRITNLVQQAAWTWAELPVPTIAAVHGVALGGGLQIALAADLRIVAPDAQLSVLEIRWGLVPDMTGTWTLPRLVGLDVAKELTWSGRMVAGDEAARIGLATRVAVEPRAAALDLARGFAGASPDAVRRAKALLGRSAGDTAAEHFVQESREMAALLGAPNQLEAVAAYFEGREPRFTDPGLLST